MVQFGSKRSERELVPLGRLAPENPGTEPADPEDWATENLRDANGQGADRSEEPDTDS
jgi:hypothetical protein